MRISDLSSDVCSSDLGALDEVVDVLGLRAVAQARTVVALIQRDDDGLSQACGHKPRSVTHVEPSAGIAGDRKSVGVGKRVSVRVDFCGSRIIKQKNK